MALARFTWSNGRELTDRIMERIDRVYANPSWSQLFPDANVLHLPRTNSDHRPIILYFKKRADGGERPFRFESCWLSDPSFKPLVKDIWNRANGLFNSAIENFKEEVFDWNNNVFGHVKQKKRRLLARIRGTQNALMRNPSQTLIELEKQLLEEFQVVL